MQKEILIKSLTNTNLVSPSTAAEIAGHFKHKLIPKNHFLLTEGKVSDEYLFIEKGYMRAFAHDTEGNEVTTNFCSPARWRLKYRLF